MSTKPNKETLAALRLTRRVHRELKAQPKPKPKPRYERVEVYGNQCIRDVRHKRIIALCTEFGAAVLIVNALNRQKR